MNKTKRKFRTDKYRKARGGYSRLLEISCAACGVVICEYQKDGPGPLKRMYADRIMGDTPSKHVRCKGCRQLIGVYCIYEKEKRPAYRMKEGSFKKKIVKL